MIIDTPPHSVQFHDSRKFFIGKFHPLNYQCSTSSTSALSQFEMSSPQTKSSKSLARAAQYLRMSTEHQQYSIENQSAAIALYAAAHDIGIVRSYVDAGKSGITIARRDGLQALLNTVSKGQPDFKVILVYDVSRWGRFQDADEAAHYEFLCKRAGIQVRYCSEHFENDNSPTSNLLKAIKRTMAAEYSRELSNKVHAAKCRLRSLGFWEGGPAPYGTRRQLIDSEGNKKELLEWGQQKSIVTDRSILVPGPADEISDIRRIFNLFTKRKLRRCQICEALTKEGRTFRGKSWSHSTIRGILVNPVYAGRFLFPLYRNGRSPNKFISYAERSVERNEPTLRFISDRQFENAQRLLREQLRRRPKSQMLDDLRHLLKRSGRISVHLIDEDPRLASTHDYANQFGRITEAYRLIGYSEKGLIYIPIDQLKELRSRVLSEFSSRVAALGGTVVPIPKRRDVLLVNSQLTVAIRFAVPRMWRDQTLIWTLCPHANIKVDFHVIARLHPAKHKEILDCFVVPRLADVAGVYHIKEEEIPAFLNVYRATDLSDLISALARSQVLEDA